MKTTITVLLLDGLSSCASFTNLEAQVAETRAALVQSVNDSQIALATGEIDQEEYDRQVKQAQDLALARLEEIPQEAAALIDANKEDLMARGKTFGYTVLELLLAATLGGGVLVGGRKVPSMARAMVARKEQYPV